MKKSVKSSICREILSRFVGPCAMTVFLVLGGNVVYAETGVSWSHENNRTLDADYDISHAESATAVSLGSCMNITINSKELKATVIGDNANIVQGLSTARSDITVADGIKINTFIQSSTNAGLRAFGVDLLGTDAGPNKLVLGRNTTINVEALGGGYNNAYGIYNYEKSDIILGDDSSVVVKNNSGNAFAILHDGSNFVKGNLTIGDNVSLKADITDGQAGAKNFASGLDNQKGDVVNAGNRLYIEATSITHADGARARVDAVNNLYGAETTIGDDLVIAAKSEGTTGEIKSHAIYNYQSELKTGANAVITTSAAGNADNSNVNAWAVVNQDNSQMTFGDNVRIQARASESGLSVAVLNQTDSTVDFEGSLYVDGEGFSLYSTGGAVINALASGKDKILIGDMYSNSDGKINVLLDTEDSLFEGAALIGTAGGEINFTMSDRSLWKMLGDSSVTTLAANDGAVVDMTRHDDYQQLEIGKLNGSGGEFFMKTDLSSEINSDKLYITDAAAGTRQFVQVNDVSIINDDVVARVGQFDTDIKSYGDYPDKANAKSHAYSLSVEYGKTIELNKQAGTFIEPQVQFIAGRLGSSSYTTDRGNNVYLGGINGYIGRIGFIAGQKTPDGNDVYFKANVLKEFGGSNRDIHMLAANGETLSMSKDYADTWFELGLGANIKLGKTSHFYGDIERSFGADIQKKWQVNAGVRFEF